MTNPSIPPKPLAVAIAIVALLWFAAAIYAGVELSKMPSAEPPPPSTSEIAPPPPPALLEKQAYRGCLLATVVLAAIGGIVSAGAVLSLAASQGESRRQPVIAILVAGVISGSMLLLIATRFFAEDFNLLSDWVTKSQTKGTWKVILALFGMILGAGITFAATIPARSEERNDQTLRRLVYGTNAFVSGLLVLIGLVVLNVVAAVRLPGKLDTTETGFFTLAPTTQDYIKSLDQKVTVYALLSDDRTADDTRWLLSAAQDLNPQKFVTRTIGVSPRDLAEMRSKFKTVEFDTYGLVVAVGEDESRYSFIRAGDLVRNPTSSGESRSYVGEGRLMRELLFLGDAKEKAVAYFTQGNGEMTLETGAESTPKRSISILKTYLESANISVKPLIYDPKAPKLPDDAAVIVVADPRSSVSPELAAALKGYMLDVRPGGKKGKLIVISGPSNQPGKTTVQPTGLEELLAEMNINLQAKYIYGGVRPDWPPPEDMIGALTLEGMRTRNPVALTLQRAGGLLMPNCRPVEPISPGNQAYTATPLLGTLQERPTWLEDVAPPSAFEVYRAILSNPQIAQAKQASRRSRGLAAAVSDRGAPGSNPVGRLFVYGSADLFNDETARAQPEGNEGGQVLAASIDWLRDRPFVEVANKPYGVYKPKADMDSGRVLLLPLGLTVLILAAIGGTVWIVRRK